MTDKQIVEDFLYFLNNHRGYITTDTDNTYHYLELRTSIINCLNQAMEDGYKQGYNKAEADALFDVSVSQMQKDW
jgi:hypothetical protein